MRRLRSRSKTQENDLYCKVMDAHNPCPTWQGMLPNTLPSDRCFRLYLSAGRQQAALAAAMRVSLVPLW